MLTADVQSNMGYPPFSLSLYSLLALFLDLDFEPRCNWQTALFVTITTEY